MEALWGGGGGGNRAGQDVLKHFCLWGGFFLAFLVVVFFFNLHFFNDEIINQMPQVAVAAKNSSNSPHLPLPRPFL